MEFDITAVDNASDAFRAVANSMDGTEKKANQLIAEVSKFVTFGLVSAKVWEFTQAASDLGEAINLNERIFGSHSAKMREWAEGGAESFGLSTSAALDFSAQIGGALQNLGYDMDDASVATQDLIERAADMASAFNKDVTQAIFAVQAGLRGETEPLRQFNVFLDEARIKAEAMSLGLYDGTGALDKFGKAMAVQSLIMKDTAQIAGDFQMTSDGLANSQRILQAHMENLKTSLGTAFLPVVEKVFGVFNGIASAANDMNPIIGQSAVTFGLVGSAVAAFTPRLKALYTTMATAGGGGLTGAFKTLGKTAAATAAVMAAMELTSMASDWGALYDAVDQFMNATSRLGSSAEMFAALEKQEAVVENLSEKVRLFNVAMGETDGSFSDFIGGIGEWAGALIQGRDPVEALTKAEEELKIMRDAAIKVAQAERAEEERIQATMGVTKQSSEDLTTAVADINTAWEDGRSAADLFRQALDNLIDSQFGSLDALAAYEGSVDDFTEALKTAAKTGMSWQEVMSMQEAEARGLQSAAKGLVGDIVNLAMEEYETAEATKGHEAAMRSASAVMETKFNQALQKLQNRFGITREEAEMLLGSFDDYNLAELVDKNPQVKTEGVERGVDDSLDAIGKYNRAPMDDKDADVDPSGAIEGSRTGRVELDKWNGYTAHEKFLKNNPKLAQSGSRDALAALSNWNRARPSTKEMKTRTNAYETYRTATHYMNAVRSRTVDLTIRVNTGSLYTAIGLANKLANMPGLAEGGPVKPGQVYMVGERGPELFVSAEGGTIIPNHELHSLRPSGTSGAGVGGGSGGDYAPIVLKLDSEVVWRGMVDLRRRRGALGLS